MLRSEERCDEEKEITSNPTAQSGMTTVNILMPRVPDNGQILELLHQTNLGFHPCLSLHLSS